jgi:hypothetical protein
MFDPKFVELTDGLIQSQFSERRQSLAGELRAIGEELNSRGMFHSSDHVRRVVEICRHEIETRGWIVYNAHARVLSQLAIEPYPELSRDLKGRLSYFLPLGDDYAQAPKELATRLGLQSRPEIGVGETREHVLSKIGVEIDLFAETVGRRKQQGADQTDGKSVYNFYSGVGAVQTGTGSTANVVQHIGSQEKQALQEALQAVRDAVSFLKDNQDFRKSDIIELVDEANSEVAKPTPNRLKLSSLLTTIGDTIRAIGSINSVYQLFKTALLPFGITLP